MAWVKLLGLGAWSQPTNNFSPLTFEGGNRALFWSLALIASLSPITLQPTVASVLVHQFHSNVMMKAEHMVAIRTLDYPAAISFGAVAALLSWCLMPEVLHKPIVIMAGMGVGLTSVFALLGLFSFLLARFESVVMSLQISMFAGIVGRGEKLRYSRFKRHLFEEGRQVVPE